MSDKDFLKKCDSLISALSSVPVKLDEQAYIDKINFLYNQLDSLKKSIEHMGLLKEDSGWTRVPNSLNWTHPSHGLLEVNRKEGKINVAHINPRGVVTRWGSWSEGPNVAATVAEMTRRKMVEGGMLSPPDPAKKSDYGKFKGGSMYSAADNARRKATNTGDVAEGAGKNVNVKAYSSKIGQLSAKQSAEEESKRYRQLNRKQPVRTFSPEEIAAINEQRKKLASSIDIDAKYDEKIAKKEHEIANNLANLLKLNPNVDRRPANDWIAEASKPISKRFSSDEEEAAYWNSIKISDRDDQGSGY